MKFLTPVLRVLLILSVIFLVVFNVVGGGLAGWALLDLVSGAFQQIQSLELKVAILVIAAFIAGLVIGSAGSGNNKA